MNKKTKAALVSIISNTVLVFAKLFVGIVTQSVSIISEAIHSGLDLVASFIAFFAVQIASKPADKEHQYGHGKFENVSGTLEAVLIFIAAIWIIYEAYHKLFDFNPVNQIGLGLLVMGFSGALNWVISSYLQKIAREEDSIALEADALHLRTDVYTSVGVFMGLLLIKFTGWSILDPIIAIFVALLIIKESLKLTKRAFLPLLDTRLEESQHRKIVEALQVYASDYIEFHKLRTRKAGAEIHVDLHLVVPKDWAIGKVHILCNEIELKLEEVFPNCQCLIHTEPCNDRCDNKTNLCESDECPLLGTDSNKQETEHK
ncbi:MAG: cation transporter [Peptococcaceae bacterium BICA1-8]|nr:MAG: cation transporter [Peptococcaceae bacterium BICA1-8]